ncbi:efflux RND transporter periplasmic adaptor subunit [Sphingopyxis sp. SCN 67-31]|uniref:efflux RND transporter periplasmic adaptor subunit n=1 Tax=Sphingopyxis sp. SCN 67-31 TaxID=1660142 RepID=UPI00086D934B|nr:efflux RND transporter periplasmic adaptor subunit [Sphingopyxis sp. SCN 67-31]ODU34702.1 MAG: hypothetical protein ABS88_01955 [Sphingopyxis sp. SCN 67-31]
MISRNLLVLPLAYGFMLSGCQSPADTAAADPVAAIEVAPVTTGNIDEKVTLYGAAEANGAGKYTLSAPMEALVQAVDAPVGTQVRRGQILVRLSPSPTARLDLVTASANANAADLAHARARRLRADGLVSDADVETARAAKQTADAARASLATRNGALVLRAPASGTVEIVGASAGELVAPGTTIVSLVKAGDLRARFGVDPAIARRIPQGSSVEITAAGSKTAFSVPILSVDSVVDPITKTASVYVQIPDESGVGAGESLTGRVLLGNIAGGMTIPYAALLDDGGQPFVFVIVQNIAMRRDIVAGPRTGDRISITSGLKPGERVATAGVTALEDGMKVRIQSAKK